MKALSGAIVLAIWLVVGCGGDSLRLSLPDGNRVLYLAQKPSGMKFNVECDAKNASVWASNEEKNSMRLRCVAALQDHAGQPIASAASIRIIAEIQEQGNAPADGSRVQFSTDKGSFEAFGPDSPTPVRSVEVETRGGRATANIFTFPGESGEAIVNASYQTIGAKNVSDSTRVVLSEGMGVMVEGGCQAERFPDENHTFVFMIKPSCQPADVEPISGEPYHMDAGIIHNPRDGIVSLIFAVDGEEGYYDNNNNGRYDSEGDSFVGYDIPEPFLDINDNGAYDTGENFIDTNGDGKWSDANGKWDGDTVLWRAAHIMFSGRPHFSAKTTHFEPSGINIQSGGSQSLTLYLMDINMNPIAGGGSGMVRFHAEGGAEIDGDYEKPLVDIMGAEFTPDGTVIPQTLQENRSYTVSLKDADPNSSAAVNLRTTIEWRPAPYNDLYSPNMQTENLPVVTGTAQ